MSSAKADRAVEKRFVGSFLLTIVCEVQQVLSAWLIIITNLTSYAKYC